MRREGGGRAMQTTAACLRWRHHAPGRAMAVRYLSALHLQARKAALRTRVFYVELCFTSGFCVMCCDLAYLDDVSALSFRLNGKKPLPLPLFVWYLPFPEPTGASLFDTKSPTWTYMGLY